jgi:hypothetical protein
MRLFKKKVTRVFQTRFDEHVIDIKGDTLIRVADDINRNVVMVWFGMSHIELTRENAASYLEGAVTEIQEVINHLKGVAQNGT